MQKNFDFKWKLVENYAAAIVGALFIWLFVEGITEGQNLKLAIAILILAVAPFLVTFLDKRSSSSSTASSSTPPANFS